MTALFAHAQLVMQLTFSTYSIVSTFLKTLTALIDCWGDVEEHAVALSMVTHGYRPGVK